MIKLQIVNSGRTGEQRVTMEGGELAEAEDEEERAEAGEAEKERGVMAKDKEETSVGEKETYKCSEEKGGRHRGLFCGESTV